jgi:molybdopterin converting factor small subunit
MVTMSIRIHLHPDMSYLAGNNDVVETAGRTVGECIEQLIARHPALRELIFYRNGQLQTFCEIYVNRKAAYPDELSRKVEAGDEIYLTLTIAGG